MALAVQPSSTYNVMELLVQVLRLVLAVAFSILLLSDCVCLSHSFLSLNGVLALRVQDAVKTFLPLYASLGAMRG